MADELPTGWQELPLERIARDAPGAVAIGPFGSRMKSDRYVDKGVPVIRGNNLSGSRYFTGDFVYVSEETADELRNCNVFEGDLVFPHRGAIGEVGIVTEGKRRFILSTSLMKLTCNLEQAYPLYVYYYFRSHIGRQQLLQNASQVGTPGIATPLTSLKAARVILPPLPEQQRVAGLLGSLDDKIELNHQMYKSLETMVRSIFKAWFIDFEPVKEKAEGATGFRGMPQDLFDQLPNQLVENELGPIPLGWTSATVRGLGLLSRDSVQPADHPDETFEHFSIPAFDAGLTPMREAGRTIQSSKYLVTVESVLVSKLNPRFPRVWLPSEPEDGKRQVASTEFLVVVPRQGWAREYLYCQFTEQGFREQMQQMASGTSNSHQRVKPEDFQGMLVVVPPQQIREAFTQIIKPMFLTNAGGISQSVTLAAIRDALLPKLLSGKIRVPGCEGVDDAR